MHVGDHKSFSSFSREGAAVFCPACLCARGFTPCRDVYCQMGETNVIVGPEAISSEIIAPKNKPAPQNGKMPLRFVYHPSPDGVDENLLIMLHGLGMGIYDSSHAITLTVSVVFAGDTEAPFANLGRKLRLPQTSVLALRAPSK